MSGKPLAVVRFSSRCSIFALLVGLITLTGGMPARAETITWTNPAGGSWHTASNWDLGRVPAAGDDVVIPAGFPAITFSSGITTVNSLVTDSPLTQSGGTLNIGVVGTFGALVSLSGGDLGGDANFIFNGGLTWEGATLSGTGTATVPVGQTLTINSSIVLGRALESFGTSNIGTFLSFWFDGGSFTNRPGATAHFTGVVSASVGGSTPTGTITNQGTLIKSGAGAFRTFPGPLSFVNDASGVIDIQGGSLEIDGGGTNSNAGSIDVDAGASLVLGGSGTTHTAGSLLSGSGTISGNVNTNGTVSPGSSPGALTINGNFTQGATGQLHIEVGGPVAGTDFDVLSVSGAATLNGSLHATLINGFAPLPTDSFEFLSAGSVAGTFANVAPCSDTVTYAATSAAVQFDHAPPAISDQPDSATVNEGDTAVFSLVASGGAGLGYQWRKDGNPLADGPTGNGSSISGATTATLTIASAQASDAGSYDCIVSDDCGSSTSAGASLTVQSSECIEWSLRATTGPSPRVDHAMAYDSARDMTVLFGGLDNLWIGDTWEWNGSGWSLRATTGPTARYGHGMAYDSVRGVTVLFGGWDGAWNGETWEWNGSGWSLRATGGPSPRVHHEMVYDSDRGVTILFGGQDGGLDAETWEWNGSSWSLRATTGPSPRAYHAMAYDSTRAVTVLFGGFDGTRDAETWEWNGSSWSLLATGGPSPREKHAMAYNSARGVTVLFGGVDGARNAETWEWDGVAWTQSPLQGPSARYHHALTYDSLREACVMFGGYDGALDSETWELGSANPVQITDHPEAISVPFGSIANFRLTATGGGTLAYQWRRDGMNLANGETGTGSTIAGATTATLTISSAQFADEGSYDCIVSNSCGGQTSSAAQLDVNPVSGPRLYLTRTPTDPCVGPGDTMTVQLRMSDLGGQTASGYQAYLSYDPVRLQYVSGVYTAAPFGLHIIDPIAVDGGEIDIAASIDFGGGQSGSSQDAVLATLTFNVLSSAGSSSVAFRPHEPPSRIVGGEEEISATLENLPQFSVDTAPPVLTLPADATIECSDPSDPAFTGGATATDDSDANPLVTFSDTETAGACPQERTITRRWRAEDCAGNVAEADQTVTVQDTTPPNIATAASAQTVECDGAGNAAALSAWLSANGGATAEDNCGAVTWTNDFSALSDECGATGSATVTFTATDECGNSSTTSAMFAIADTTPPTFGGAPTTLTLECADAGNDAAIAAWLASAAADDACGSAGVGHDYTGLMPGSCPGTGSATVTWTATDLCGLTADHVAIAQVIDTTPPVFSSASGGALPAIETIADAGLCTATVAVATPAVTDACDSGVSVNGVRSDALSLGDPYPSSGSTTITWTATDCSGNSAVVTQVVSVAAVNEIDIDLELAGGGYAPSFVRCIRFEVFPEECSPPVIVEQNVTFAAGVAIGVVVQVPCGSYGCITARDPKHSLRRTDSDDFGTTPIIGLRYRADFTDRSGAGGDNDALLQGNLHQDNNEYRYVDILDFAVLLSRFGQAAAVDTACGFGGRHADPTGDGGVDLNDFTLLLSNFGRVQEGNCCGGGALTGAGRDLESDVNADEAHPIDHSLSVPRTSITVAELLALGLDDLLGADRNADGVVDLADLETLGGAVRSIMDALPTDRNTRPAGAVGRTGSIRNP